MRVFQFFAVYIILAGGVFSCQRKQIKEQSSPLSYIVIDSLVRKDPDAALVQLQTLSNTQDPKYYFYKGFALIAKNQIPEAEYELIKGLQLISSSDSMYPKISYQLGRVNYSQGKFREAQAYATQVLSSPTVKPKLAAETNIMLGILSKNLSDKKSAETFYKKALAYFISIHDSVLMASTYHNLATLDNSQPQKSMVYIDKAIEIRQNQGDTLRLLRSFNVKAENYKELKQYTEAIDLQNSIIQELIRRGDSVELAFSYLSLGDVYRYKEDFATSNEYIEKSLALFKNQQNIPLQLEAYKGLLASYFEKNNVREGFYFESLIQLNDSLHLLNAEIIEQETEQKIKTLLALKQAEIDKSNLEKVRAEKKLLQIQFFFVVLLAILALFILYRSYRRYKLYLAEKEIENKLLLENIQKIKVSEKEALERLLVLGQGMVENKDVFDQILQELDAAKKTGSINTKEIELSIKNRNEKIEDREVFIYYLQRVQEGFMQNIKAKFPTLTETEIKVCGFISLDLNSKKIGTLLNVEAKSVRMYQYRIRKKLGLSTEDSLSSFLKSI